ncbi:ExeM/NucH family extracellular endonuclease [Cutibacterium sp. WCA-380-WT-3A]|uniref:ExeM/NucH family extracellular endonuclease n=1 Tax=Cutibacterium porci TaxID=2605781 RepID=A0A7K0J983_9ACTN|nr:ExeM/NucH family extracellular endonuclease [Cutibacterium porci]MSS46506.1 ExeM/NucH family extracellular endonuclease [Cutibacterium porci]
MTTTSRRVLASLAAASCSTAMILGMVEPVHADAAAADHVVINEVYGGGGNAGATWTHDFVELLNPTSSDISVQGWALEYLTAQGKVANTCTLQGSVKAGGYFLIQEAKGNGGNTSLPTPDALCTASMSATQGSVRLNNASGATLDLVGYGAAAAVETHAAPAPSSTSSISRRDGTDTDDNSSDFTVGDPTPMNSGSGSVPSATATPTPSSPANPAQIPISQIQGVGPTSPMVNKTVSTLGVVTATYATGGYNGIYIQTPGSGGIPKKATDASDGVFVYSPWAASNVKVGDCVAVKGTVTEYHDLTEIGGNTRVDRKSGCVAVKPTNLATLPATDAEREAYEGMLVRPTSGYTITNNYGLNQYGQIGLASGDQPLYQGTEVALPGKDAESVEAANIAKYINLDDGASWNFMTDADAKKSPLPYLSQDTPMRIGTHVEFTSPVIMDQRFGWNFQPIGHVVGSDSKFSPIKAGNNRPANPPAVGGNVKLGSFNVLSYFTDLGQDEPNCKPYVDREGTPISANSCLVRGAYTPKAFADQQAKIVTAINGLGADVVSLEEVENSAQITWHRGQPRDASLANLVGALNKAAGSTVWAYVPSPIVVPPNEDVIRSAFIYKVGKVSPIGASQILADPAFSNARQPLAQRVQPAGSKRTFVAVVNHFKSKGSGDDDGTGQGKSNPSRLAQARALTGWVNKTFADDPVFMLGDFNAYAMEDPIRAIKDAGFSEVVEEYDPDAASYQFSGRVGSLDHIFANGKAYDLVTGAGIWDINGAESVAMQYSRRNYNVTDFYTTSRFGASDHSPALVGFSMQAPASTPTASVRPSVSAFTPMSTVSDLPSAPASQPGAAGMVAATSENDREIPTGLPHTGV